MTEQASRDAAWSAINETARAVAAMRALDALLHGEHALVRDPCISALLDGGRFDDAALAGIRIPAALRGDLPAIARWLAQGRDDDNAVRLVRHVDRLAIRTAAINDRLRACLAGIDQLVIVGAGLDTRAFSLDALADVDVFEVDFPHVLAFKDARLGHLRPACRSRHAIGCDVTSAAFPAALCARGFDRDAPALWLIEGVLVYLTAAQIDTLNRSLADLSARGSRLLATIMGSRTPETFSDGMISRFDDPQALFARYGWQTRARHYAELARDYGRDYPAGHDVYLVESAPRGGRPARRDLPSRPDSA